MFDFNIAISDAEFSSLAAEMKNTFGTAISGCSYNGSVLRTHFFEMYDTADEVAAQGVVDLHDPVHIEAVRAGTVVNVTLRKPLNLDSATELTLTLDGEAVPSATSLVANVGVAVVNSEDQVTIGIDEDYPYQQVYV